MLGREPTAVELHNHTHRRQQNQQWVDDRARRTYDDYTRLRESQAAAGEGSSAGSADVSDYHTWTHAISGMQKERIYGLGSQASEEQSSSAISHSVGSQESLVIQQVANLAVELENVRKTQANMNTQILDSFSNSLFASKDVARIL
ncbi:hypothetical protein M5K25_019734 [Dendrobium thyrsiflorum]|uniref:Uncharacterized protein n=1 Tax=Dendrobium thyrsiflorum TaxID=117978 RepID=A0ABD0UFP5_DENTH